MWCCAYSINTHKSWVVCLLTNYIDIVNNEIARHYLPSDRNFGNASYGFISVLKIIPGIICTGTYPILSNPSVTRDTSYWKLPRQSHKCGHPPLNWNIDTEKWSKWKCYARRELFRLTKHVIQFHPLLLNSLGPFDVIRRQTSGSTLAQVMACCRRDQAITWIYVDLSSVGFVESHLGAISQNIPQPSVT